MPSKNPEPLGAILPSDARQAPDVDQVALARESDEGDESNRIVRPAERVESSSLLGRREFCDHVDKLMRFVVSYPKEGDLVGREKRSGRRQKREEQEGSWSCERTVLDETMATTPPQLSTRAFQALSSGVIEISGMLRRSRVSEVQGAKETKRKVSVWEKGEGLR